MQVSPDFAVFERLYRAGQAQCLATRLVSDLETPVSAYLKLKALIGDQPSFLLESVEGGAVKGRHSIIGLRPDLIWRCRNGTSEIARDGGPLLPCPASRSMPCARSWPRAGFRASRTCPHGERRFRLHGL